MLDKNSDNEETFACYNEGLALYSKKKYQETLDAFERAIQLELDFSEMWTYKGLELIGVKKPHEVLEAFTRTLHLNPKDALAWASKGAILLDLFHYLKI